MGIELPSLSFGLLIPHETYKRNRVSPAFHVNVNRSYRFERVACVYALETFDSLDLKLDKEVNIIIDLVDEVIVDTEIRALHVET